MLKNLLGIIYKILSKVLANYLFAYWIRKDAKIISTSIKRLQETNTFKCKQEKHMNSNSDG